MTPQERPAAVVAPWRVARKVVVAVIGATVLAVGVALIVLPGPAVVVVPLGLAILGTEFLWARRLLQRLRTAPAGSGALPRQAPCPPVCSPRESAGVESA